MIHFKRFLWLAAWSVWAWLGFGLYRELPRDLGPLVSRISLAKGHDILGFIGESDVVAIQEPPVNDMLVRTIKRIDSTSGKPVGENIGPLSWIADRSTAALQHGFVFSRMPPGSAGKYGAPGLWVVNLHTGTWRNLLPEAVIADVAFHPRKPLIAATSGHVRSPPYKAAVFDLVGGRQLFDRVLESPALFTGKPLFVPDRDELVLPISEHGTPKTPGGDPVLEVWKLGDSPALKSIEVEIPMYRGASISNDGRLYFDGRLQRMDVDGSSWDDVYDLKAGKLLSSVPPDERAIDKAHQANAHFPVISSSGRTILRGSPAALYEIGSGGVLWTAGPHEELAAPSSQEVFLVSEHWGTLWQRWLPRVKFESKAVRDRDTGELLYRTRRTDVVLPFNSNSPCTLVVLPNGEVHRLPLRVNYPLLVLCQTILALPLILLWAVMRWRRNKKAASATAA